MLLILLEGREAKQDSFLCIHSCDSPHSQQDRHLSPVEKAKAGNFPCFYSLRKVNFSFSDLNLEEKSGENLKDLIFIAFLFSLSSNGLLKHPALC